MVVKSAGLSMVRFTRLNVTPLMYNKTIKRKGRTK